jgi:hypothetical protein
MIGRLFIDRRRKPKETDKTQEDMERKEIQDSVGEAIGPIVEWVGGLAHKAGTGDVTPGVPMCQPVLFSGELEMPDSRPDTLLLRSIRRHVGVNSACPVLVTSGRGGELLA